MTFLAILWFCIAAVLLAVYAVLDGFDLGVGVVYGFTRDRARRGRVLGAISPIWSGNEVWLLAGIGSLLAAFTPVYSALLSSLYVPVILVLMALVFRACGVELRTKTHDARLGAFLDVAILVGSLVPAWGIGLAAGNVLVGLPLDAQGNVAGGWLFFMNPFAIVAGFVSLAAFGIHGLLYLALKSEDGDREAFFGFARTSLGIFACVVVACGLAAPFVLGGRFAASSALPAFWAFAIVAVLAYSGVFLSIRSRRAASAFGCSALGIVSMVLMSAALLFPVLIPSSLGRENDLTVAKAAAADPTLKVMLILSAIAVPLIAVYSFVAYRSFRGPAVAHREED